MRHLFQSASVWLLAGIAVVGVGCRNGDNDGQSPPTEKQITTTNTSGVTPKPKTPSPEDVVREEHRKLPPEIPKLSITDRETCIVFQGDPIPAATLPDLDGNSHRLQDLLGDKVTVILFWSSGDKRAVRALGYAGEKVPEFRKPHTEKEARLIGINVGDSPEAARKAVQSEGVEFINLLDEDASLFHHVATEGLPRVYLVDAEGKILWLEDQYRTTTEDALRQAMGAVLNGEDRSGGGDGSP